MVGCASEIVDSDTSRTGDASARRLDGLALFDGLRHILPWVKVEMTAYLDDRRALSGAIKARTLITGVPDRLFDGSPVCPDTLMGLQIGHEAEASELRTQPAGQENLAREVTTRIANQVPKTGYRDDYVMCSVVWQGEIRRIMALYSEF